MSTRRTFMRQAATACMVLAAAPAWAQESYPARTVTVVAPYPAGGVVDIIARLVAEKLAAAMKATFIVENRVGAGGTIGATAVANAQPDGYTLLVGGSATHIFAPALYRKLPYDPKKSFVPIGQISSSPMVLVVGSKTPAASVPELVSFLKARGDQANFASNGSGTFPHLAGELFKQGNGLAMVHVPYTGGPAAITALVRGDVAMSINHIPVVRGMIQGGKLKAIATTAAKRAAAFPDLPTLQEAGMDLEASAWFGLFAPAGTPRPIVERLTAELEKVLQDEGLIAKLAAQGEEVRFVAPQPFAAHLDRELAKWARVVRDAKISLD